MRPSKVPPTPETGEDLSVLRLQRAVVSLEGLSVGDAFGQRFFDEDDIIVPAIEGRMLPATPWWFTDDTQMALSIVECLRKHGGIDQASLARSFAENYDTTRGYGPAMHGLLADVSRTPVRWEKLAKALFGGQGSYGNGSAMRVAPLGAYFADDIPLLIEHADRSSRVTHTHEEAVAGAVAVAVAAAVAWNCRGQAPPNRQEFLAMVLSYVPDSLVHEMIRRALNLEPDATIELATAVLGNGIGLSAPDTVPFALWCAGEYLANYEKALWLTVSGLGDRDTTCAIAGGVVAAYTGVEGIPPEWRNNREPLPKWAVG